MEQHASNKELVRRFVEEVFQDGRTDGLDDLVTPDFRSPTFGITDDGRDGLRTAAERVHSMLSDVTFTIDDIVAEDDRVAVRLTSSATPTGDFMGVPAAGRSYRIAEAHWFTIRDGLIAEHWHLHDATSQMRQLGAAPAPAAT